jgi:hypothetical protein
LARLPRLKSLNLAFVSAGRDPATWMLLAERGKCLTHLSMRQVQCRAPPFGDDDSPIIALFNGCPKLDSIDFRCLEMQPATTRHLVRTYNVRMRHLRIEFNNIDHASIEEITLNYPNLKSLHLDEPHIPILPMSVALIVERCTQLETLVLVYSDIKDESLIQLCQLRRLRSLKIGLHAPSDAVVMRLLTGLGDNHMESLEFGVPMGYRLWNCFSLMW